MLTSTLFLSGGIVLLWISAEGLVRGASALGRIAGVTPIVIGLTVVSIGTSAPELVVSLLAAMQGNPDLATGNVFGSNLANIGLILGLAAVLRPLQVAGQVVKREVPWMIAVTLLVLPLMWNLRMGRVEGAILAATLFVYLFFLLRLARSEGPSLPRGVLPDEPPAFGAAEPGKAAGGAQRGHDRGWGRPGGLRLLGFPIFLVVVGAVGLVVGGRGIVTGARAMAAGYGIPEVIVGLSVIAVGTSLPELATTVIAAVRREADLAVGNIVGSNIFNLTFVLGGTALITPLEVHPILLRVEYPAMLLLSLFLLPLAWTRRALARYEGLLLLALYGGAWVWIIVMRGI